MKAWPATVKYPFTREQDDYLRRIYADHGENRRRLSEAITAFADRLRYPRHMISHRAGYLGITVLSRRPWTDQEKQTLQNLAGSKTVKFIARKLHRSHGSVKSMIDSMKLSRCLTEGYLREDVAQSLGVSLATVDKWIGRGWLKPIQGSERISEASVAKLVKNRPEQYSLKRVNEPWFKGMVFPAFGMKSDQGAA